MRGVLEGTQPGTVWSSGESALVVARFGFMQWLGECDDDAFFDDIAARLQRGDPALPGYLLWYDPPPRWMAWCRERTLRERERVRWRFEAPPERGIAMDRGLRVEGWSPALLPAIEAFGMFPMRFWNSLDDLLEHGAGMAIVDEQERVIAAAYAAGIGAGQGEIDIAVAPDHRGQGLGFLVGRELIRAFEERGILPAWDCFASNEASMRLAARLGFQPARRYVMVSFNVPLDIA
ncbi:GNAT family N-acetyltransferase [Piscinibacter terrae]|nr:GNAT family N-acetyltransferase [Albitalea terrae]